MTPTRKLTVVTTLTIPAEATHFWGGLLDAPVYLRMVESSEYNEWQLFDPELGRWCFHSKYPKGDQRQPLNIELLPASDFEIVTKLEEICTEASSYVWVTRENVSLWSTLHSKAPSALASLQKKLQECQVLLRKYKRAKPGVRNPLVMEVRR